MRVLCGANRRLFFANVFIPDGGIGANVIREKLKTFGGIEVDHFYAERAQPIHAALKIATLADDDLAKTELADEAAAIPAGRERGDHDEIAVAALASGIAKGVGFSMKGWIAVLYAPIVAGADEFSIRVENRCADGNAAFGKTLASFRQCDAKERLVIECIAHGGQYTGGLANCADGTNTNFFLRRSYSIGKNTKR